MQTTYIWVGRYVFHLFFYGPYYYAGQKARVYNF